MENLEQFLIKSKSVSTIIEQTHFEALTREKGKGMSHESGKQSQHTYLHKKKNQHRNKPIPTNIRVGKAMVCVHKTLFSLYLEH